jgi:fused signal recognition particle receptor
VGDSLAGNDVLHQAREFDSQVGIDANILTKLDADAKGGAALSISFETKKPILFVGVGQSYEDLKPFNREEFVSSILDIS